MGWKSGLRRRRTTACGTSRWSISLYGVRSIISSYIMMPKAYTSTADVCSTRAPMKHSVQWGTGEGGREGREEGGEGREGGLCARAQGKSPKGGREGGRVDATGGSVTLGPHTRDGNGHGAKVFALV